MISERRLKKWRREALHVVFLDSEYKKIDINPVIAKLSKIILTLTQELLDQHLLKKGGNIDVQIP